MDPGNQHISMSRTSHSMYEAVETGYDPGRLVASDGASNTPSPAPSEETSRPRHASHHDYKPTALRWWFHALLIVCLATFIGLTEYTLRTLQTYDGDDLASQLWSRDNSGSYGGIGRNSKGTERNFQRIPRAYGNTTTAMYFNTGKATVTSDMDRTTLTGLDNTNYKTTSTAYVCTATATEIYTISVTYTTPIAYLNTGKTTVTSNIDKITTLTDPQINTTSYMATSIAYFCASTVTILLPSTYYLHTGKTTITSPNTTTTTCLSTSLGAYLDLGKTTITSTTTTLPGSTSSANLGPGKTTITSETVIDPSPQSQGVSDSAHVITVAFPTSPTTEADTTTTEDTSAYIQIGPTSSSTVIQEYTTSGTNSAGLQLPKTTSRSSGPTFSTTEADTTAIQDTSQIETTSSFKAETATFAKSAGLQLDSNTPQPEIITGIIPGSNGGDSLTIQFSVFQAAGQTSVPESTDKGSEAPFTVGDGAQETDGPSRNLLVPAATTIIQETAAEETPSLTVVQETNTWAPSETWLAKTIIDSEGRSTVQTEKTTLPGGTSVFQATMTVPSEDHHDDVTDIHQTETWPSTEIMIEQTTTNADGRILVQTFETDSPGGTRTIQSTIAVTSVAMSSEGYQEGVTVVQQTETWPSSETTIEYTTTNAVGQTIVQTLETMLSGGTRIIQSSVSVHPGETLVTVPTVMPTTIGGRTEVVQMTFSDSQGHMSTSPYTTVIGGTPTFTTRSFYVATSLPPADTVITIATVVPTILGGTTEVRETTFTGADGSLTKSSYTTILGRTPTSTTVPVVIATPVPSGDVLVTKSAVIFTTIGGTTEVVQTAFTNFQGQLTTSSYTTVLHGTPTSTTEWTIVPTPTYTGSAGSSSNNSDPNGDIRTIVYGISLGEYFLGTFLPTLLAVLVAYPVKLISVNARLMQPFHTLATADKAQGATPESSIFLRFDTWFGALSLPRAIKMRQPIIVVSDLLVFGAALFTALVAEAVSVHVPDDCHSHCPGNLEVSVAVARIVEALMATMGALLIVLIVLLSVFRWRTGVSQNPWSIVGMASLCLDPEIRNVLRSIPSGLDGSVDDSAILKTLGKNRYGLGNFWIAPSTKTMNSRGYGVIIAGRDGVGKQLLESDASDEEETKESKVVYKRTQPFKLLTWWGRCLLIFVFTCLLIILTYYENTSADTGFERFMDSQGFGVNFFFTALGIIVGACMEMVFRSVAIISPYLQLSNGILPAERSILISPPTNAFYGVYSAIRQRHLFLGVLSFTTILGELFLPVTLSQVPFSLNETFKTQLICAWLSISILALMILVLAASFLTTWPHMPVDPRTVAGAMFYVCDSWMLDTLQGMSTMSKKDRDLDVRYLRLRYGYGYISGAVSGKERMGLDVCDDTGEAAVITRGEKLRYG